MKEDLTQNFSPVRSDHKIITHFSFFNSNFVESSPLKVNKWQLKLGLIGRISLIGHLGRGHYYSTVALFYFIRTGENIKFTSVLHCRKLVFLRGKIDVAATEKNAVWSNKLLIVCFKWEITEFIHWWRCSIFVMAQISLSNLTLEPEFFSILANAN